MKERERKVSFLAELDNRGFGLGSCTNFRNRTILASFVLTFLSLSHLSLLDPPYSPFFD